MTNTTGGLVLVCGGVVTRIAVGRSNYTLTQGTVIVQPGETVTLVYTSAPAREWRAMS